MNPTPHRALLASALTCVCLATTACTPEPTIMETPRIVWVDDIRPTSPLEDHPLVATARQAEIGRALAYNTGDFTINQLTDNFTGRLVERFSEIYSRQGDYPKVHPGPLPWEPIRIIEENEDGSGTIEVCQVGLGVGDLPSTRKTWFIEEGQKGGVFDRSRSITDYITVVVDDGVLKVSSYEDPEMSKECDGSAIAVGLFDPQPTLPPTPVTKPVRPPLD